MLKKLKICLLLTICLSMIFSFGLTYAQDLNVTFDVNSISGGIKIVNGIHYEMNKLEAQSEYLNELNYQGIKVENDKNVISPNVVVDTEIESTMYYFAPTVRISPYAYNKTSNPIEKTITGSKTITATGTSSANLNVIADRVNATTSYSVSVSATKEDSTKVTIEPGERFYITFTPRMLEVEGQQLHSLSHGITKWEDFTADLPCIVDGEADGNIYYITE